MRTIEISTDVFAAIWSRRAVGEQSEDQILRRLLGVACQEGEDIVVEASLPIGKKALWREDVRNALEALGGRGHLSEIYRKVREIRLATGRSLPPSTDAIVRRELEYNSSDSESFTGNFDWFRSRSGIGSGEWELAKAP